MQLADGSTWTEKYSKNETEPSNKFKVGDTVYTESEGKHKETGSSLWHLVGKITNANDKWNILVDVENEHFKTYGPIGFSEFELSKVYFHNENPYRIIEETKIKTEGLLKALGIPEFNNILAGLLLTGNKWMDVVIYEQLYYPKEQDHWVRMKDDFYENFKDRK